MNPFSRRDMDASRCQFRPEQCDPSAYIAESAVIAGDVTLGPQASVWHQAVIRGDTETITIGARTNVQDGAILHADPGFPCTLGDGVTIGHGAIVHGAIVENDCLIGMRAVLMNGARIGAGSIVAVGAVVLEGTMIEPNSVVMGIPAQRKREASERDRERIRDGAEHYVEAAAAHKKWQGKLEG